MAHALESLSQWAEDGRAERNSPDIAMAFHVRYANLKRYHPEYTETDLLRFLREFLKAAGREEKTTCD